MFKVALKWSVTAVALCTAMPSAKADYTYRCDPLPPAIVVDSRGPLPEGLSPLARRHVDDIRWHSERTEVVQLDAPNIIIVNYTIAKQPASQIVVALDGREHTFYLYQMRPFVISGYGVANEHRHMDIAFVGEYSLRVITKYRDDQVLGTSIEASPDYFRGRCDAPKN
jgi:hypothetical protein